MYYLIGYKKFRLAVNLDCSVKTMLDSISYYHAFSILAPASVLIHHVKT